MGGGKDPDSIAILCAIGVSALQLHAFETLTRMESSMRLFGLISIVLNLMLSLLLTRAKSEGAGLSARSRFPTHWLMNPLIRKTGLMRKLNFCGKYLGHNRERVNRVQLTSLSVMVQILRERKFWGVTLLAFHSISSRRFLKYSVHSLQR